MGLQRTTTEDDSDITTSREDAMLVMTELQCRERLQIRVQKRSSESDESERFQSY